MGCSFPKLSPSNFHLFGSRQRCHGSVKRFGSDDMVVEEVNKWLQIQSENW
jgi:hypothetical protein